MDMNLSETIDRLVVEYAAIRDFRRQSREHPERSLGLARTLASIWARAREGGYAFAPIVYQLCFARHDWQPEEGRDAGSEVFERELLVVQAANHVLAFVEAMRRVVPDLEIEIAFKSRVEAEGRTET